MGRSHALRLAADGADVLALDICADIPSVAYPLGTPEELAETVAGVEKVDRRALPLTADVRDAEAIKAAVERGVSEFGRLDIVIANAGIALPAWGIGDAQAFCDQIAVNLTGVWNTGRVAIRSMVKAGQGGSIVLTSSTGGLIGVGLDFPGFIAYTAAKHGVIGLMRSWANAYAAHNIRVNSVAPTAVRTPMASDENLNAFMANSPDIARALSNAMPVDLIEPEDVANAVAWLVSDDARYVTGTVVPVDAGMLNKR